MRNDSQIWFKGVRASKFRHVFGSSRKECYTDISIHRNGKDGNLVCVNPNFLAIEADAAFIVIPLTTTGRIDFQRCKVIGHTSQIFDLKWNPFNDYEIASASDDCTIKLWNIPVGGLTSCLSDYKAELLGHRRKVTQLEWHPTCENVLISIGFDNLVIVWDVSPNPLNGNNILKIIDCHVDQIYSLAINRDGSYIATTSKDRNLRIIEPRNGIVVSQGACHNGTKCSKVIFLSDDKVLTTGFSKHCDRQYAIWNQHDLKKPLVAADIDSSSGIIQPFFDAETKTLYLCGKGEGCIRYYEIVDEAPYIYYLNQFISGQPQKSLGWMPKRALNVASCEIFRFYKLHATGNVVEPISFIVPRKSSLFQADIYPDTLSTKPAMNINEWFVLGKNAKPILMPMHRESTNDVILRRITHINENAVIRNKDKNEENKVVHKQTEIIVESTRNSKVIADNNITKKFAFLSQETNPDYRPANERIYNKQEKTNTNQSTKIQQLQSIFGQQPKDSDHNSSPKHITSLENANMAHAENELKKIIQQQSDEIKNLRNQLKTSDKRIRELEFEVKKLRLENVKAKALYDNLAESVDELAFRKGEILDVIEQNADGMDGWWLCSLRGRIGLCPGNRLRVIDYETSSCYTPTSPLSSPCSTTMSMSASTLTFSSQNSNTSELYENTSNKNFKGKRRSWHINPNKVITPQKFGDVYLYDLLPSNANSRLNSPGPSITSSLSFDADNYDIPKAAIPVNNDIIRQQQQPRHQGISRHSVLSTSSTATSLFSRMDDSYDVPRSSSNLGKMTPSSSNSSLLTSDSLSLSFSSSNRSSLANMPDYDIPRKQPVSIKRTPPPPQSQSILSLKSLDLNSENYDVPSPHVNVQSPKKLGIIKELPLELSSALDTLSRLQNEATIGVTKLLSFVNSQWRTREKLEPIIMDIKLAVVRLKTSLHDLAEFAEGSLGNSLKTEDKNLSIKLRPLVKALKDADKLIHEACNALDAQGWNIEYLQRSEQPKNTKTKASLPPDSLDQLIVVSQTLTEDIRQTSSFIQGNASLLFKRNVTTPLTPVSQATWPEDSDYVSLESEENVAKKNAEIRNALPNNLKHNFDKVVKSAELGTDINEPLDPNDKTVLLYYTSQCCTHIKYLTQAIDSFLKTVEHNQPPKFFLAYGKFVVLSAHNLVNIGDIVHRNVTKKNVKARILSCADSLSESLKTCVMKTKKAAQSFPSVTAVQQMVDSVVDISHLASDLKLAMLEAVTIP